MKDGCKRVSKRLLNEMAYRYIEAFYASGQGIVRLSDPLRDGRHFIEHRGTVHVFETNRDAYGFMADAVKEQEERIW